MTDKPYEQRPRVKHELNFSLTDKQSLFLKYYSETLDKKQSAIRAGYPERDAHKRAHAILANKQVKMQLGKIIKRVVAKEDSDMETQLSKTLNVLDTIIQSGTTEDKLAEANVGHALMAISKKADILGLNAPDKSINVNVDMEMDRTQRLNEMIKSKEVGY